jgi:hypothetical protein
MPPRRQTRILVAVAAAVAGVVLGLVVVGLAARGGRPAPYQPFRAGLEERLTATIRQDGPVFFPDPRQGSRGFYLDLEYGQIVALHVVAPGRKADCPVQWDGEAKRYVDCGGEAVLPLFLRRFPVETRPRGDEEVVFVDLRELLPPPGFARPLTPRS